MKTQLRISLCLNLGLAAGLAFVLLNAPERVAVPAPPVVAKTLPPADTVVAQTSSHATSSTESQPFRWSQLWGRDYHAYVKNLRAIGCPEATLRAIVTADVHAAFQNRRGDLERKIAVLGGGSWINQLANAGQGENLKGELQELADGETAEIAELLGQRPVAVANTASSKSANPRLDGLPIAAPVAFQPVNQAALNLDAGQTQAIEDVRKSFLAKVGGLNQDPHDPAYLARWRQAQSETDQLMKGMLGDAAYQNYQLQAGVQAQASQAPAAQPTSDPDRN
jgi:hypothetical protein